MISRTPKHACSECDRLYHNPDDLAAHLITGHDHPGLTCSHDGCDKKLQSPSALKRHIQVQHEKRVFSCSKCNFSCSRKDNLKRHEKACSKKHGNSGRVDNDTATVSAPVPSLPVAVPQTSATDNSPGATDPASEAMSRTTSNSTITSSLATYPNLPVSATSSHSLDSLWIRLWHQAIHIANVNYPSWHYDCGLKNAERVEMRNLINEELNQGRLDFTTAHIWASYLSTIEANNFGLTELTPEMGCPSILYQ